MTSTELGKKTTGLNAPLNEVDDAVKYWIDNGAESSKLILGMGTYGHSWTLSEEDRRIGAAASGAGTAGPYTRQEGTLGYNEICENINNWNVVQDVNGVYAHSGNQWVGYDDIASIKKKVALIHKHKLGGGMIWSLETDDFRGVCNGGKYPLLRAINEGLGLDNEVGVDDDLPGEQKPSPSEIPKPIPSHPSSQCLPHDSPCRGNHGSQSTCCQGLYCHKPVATWLEGRCYNRGVSISQPGSTGCLPHGKLSIKLFLWFLDTLLEFENIFISHIRLSLSRKQRRSVKLLSRTILLQTSCNLVRRKMLQQRIDNMAVANTAHSVTQSRS